MTTDMAARYAKAESMLGQNMRKLVHSARVDPRWIEDTETFWYRNTTDKGTEFILVDAVAGTKQPAFDHERMAEALSGVLDQAVESTALPFQGIEFVDDA